MKICIFGAGAIGGYLGAELAASGADVTLIARGDHLAAMRAGGLKLIQGDETRTVHPACTDDPAEAGAQDAVIVTLKAHTAPAAVDSMRPLLGPETSVVTAVNGIPWWYFHGLDGPHAEHRLASVDPGDRQWDGLGPERAIGCILYAATEIVEPGVIRHVSGDRFTLGEPDGSRSDRVMALAAALSAAGLKAPVRPRIRDEIWMKLWGNVSFNPISVLTGATLEDICRDPDSRAVARTLMIEAKTVGEALGIRFALDVDKRIAGAEAVGAHKTSMLQDFERRRPLEIEPVVGVVAEMARLTGVATPTLDAVLSLTRARARSAGIPEA